MESIVPTSSKKPTAYKIEDHVNDWVKAKFDELGLKNQQDYYTESAIPDYLKEALKGRAKTEKNPVLVNPILACLIVKKRPLLLRTSSGLKN